MIDDAYKKREALIAANRVELVKEIWVRFNPHVIEGKWVQLVNGETVAMAKWKIAEAFGLAMTSMTFWRGKKEIFVENTSLVYQNGVKDGSVVVMQAPGERNEFTPRSSVAEERKDS